MSAAIAEKPKSQVVAAYSRMKTTLAKNKEKAKAGVMRGANVAISAGAGYAVGMAYKNFGDHTIPGTDIPSIPVVGGALAVLGMSGIADEYSAAVASMGGGTLAGYLALTAAK